MDSYELPCFLHFSMNETQRSHAAIDSNYQFFEIDQPLDILDNKG